MFGLTILKQLKKRTKGLKKDLYTLYLAYRDPRTPLYAKIFILLIVGYAFSPIDLIPDFIPVIGYLDDLLIVPLGIVLSLKMIPAEVVSECRLKAEYKFQNQKPKSYIAAAIIVLIWIAVLLLLASFCVKHFIRK